MVVPSEEELTSRFEELAEEGVVIWGPYKAIEISFEGYPMEFRICPALTRKPNTVRDALDPTTFGKARQWGPGSDLYLPDERLIITQLNNSHDLAFNLFCVDKPQLLMVTRDSYRRQTEPLDADDFTIALQILLALDNFYVIYNCSERGGCSRTHKHLQGLRGPPRTFDLFIDSSNEVNTKIPFRYFIHYFEQGFQKTTASSLLVVYEQLLGKTREVLEISKEQVCPHNVVLWKGWMIIIPRGAGEAEGVSANTGGMMGSVWLPHEKAVEPWRRLSSMALKKLGVPNDSSR